MGPMNGAALLDQRIGQMISQTIVQATQADLALPDRAGQIVGSHRGKVRDSLLLADGRRVLITTDRISAFDVVLGTIPCKGQVLNQLSAYWFKVCEGVVPTHFLAVPDPNIMVVRGCRPLPVEMVMRAYLTGVTSTSIWRAYEGGARVFCGHPLPEGMKKNEPLPRPLLTPSTKAEAGGGLHDESLSADELLRRGLLDEETLAQATALCARLFALGQERARARGLILADTKYELGWADGPEGRRLLFIDEVHTPDSSRYWYADDYERRLSQGQEPRSLDKEYVRRYLAERGYRGEGPPPPLPAEVRIEAARRYIEAYELLTGARFVPDLAPPLPRMRDNLEAFLS